MRSSLSVGLIGSGSVSRLHAAHWLAVGARVTVHSLLGAEELAAEHGLEVVQTLDELLETVDVVDVCTPTVTHRPLATAAIEAGKHVLCEKPLGRSIGDALAIAASARAARVQVYPAHVVRFFPEYAAAHASVTEGNLGPLAVLRFSRGGAGPTSDWFFDDAESGGIVLDQMIHDLDQARWFAGEVSQVYAVQSPPIAAGRLPSTVTAHVTLVHVSGAISHIDGVWGPPGMDFRTSFDIAGAKATLRFDSSRAGTSFENLGTGGGGHSSYLPPAPAEESPYLTQIREVARAFQGGPRPRVTLADGVIAVALAEAARTSIVTGVPVDFDASALVAIQEAVAV